jgi:hypothetical protein
VTGVQLIGSRARGEATPRSDWDFHVDVTDLPAVARDLPALAEPLAPLGQLWDPLSDRHVYALILPGPVKVDLLFDEPHEHEPPWQPSPATLPAIDTHFWDWTLWLTGKAYAGRGELVRAELAKMSAHLLRPLGIDEVPATIGDAARRYRAARDRLEAAYGMAVPRQLAEAISPLAGA